MSNVRFQLPLLKLPERGMKLVLQQMQFHYLLSFSFLSRRAKTAVASLQHLHPQEIVIDISESITIRCIRNVHGYSGTTTFGIFKKPCGITPDTTVLPTSVRVEVFRAFAGRGTSFPSRKRSFGLKQYMEHILDIYKCTMIKVCFNTPFAQTPHGRIAQDVLPVEPLYDAFKNVNIGVISIRTRFSEQLIKRFLPRTDAYEIVNEHPFNKQFLRTILIQNLTKFDLHAVDARFTLTLDDLLMTNSSHMTIKTNFNEKDLNTFFRNWQLGSNPRLKHINMEFITPRELNEDLILKRTQCQQEFSRETTRIVYRIQRVGGIRAEIEFRRDHHGISIATYSFISDSTKNSIAALETNRSQRVAIFISNTISIRSIRSPNQPEIQFRIFNDESNQITPESTVLPIPKYIEVSRIFNGIEQRSRMTNCKELGLKQFLDYFLGLFPPNAIKKALVSFETTEREIFPTEILYDAFEGLIFTTIHTNTRFYEQLTKKLLTRATDYFAILTSHPFSDEYIQSLLIQNFSILTNYCLISLDDLLMIERAENADCSTSCTTTGLGSCASRNHMVATEEEMRERGQWQKLIFPPDITGPVFGWNIRQTIDGREATVAFITTGHYCAMYLFVED